MLKKRLIFTLLYDNGYFMLSRNFRLQKVGDLDWLLRNYNLRKVALFLDELILLDVTRGPKNSQRFLEILKSIASNCCIPIAAGGGVKSLDHSQNLLRSGADKIVVNTALFEAPHFVKQLIREFGQQCIVGSVDFKREDTYRYSIYTHNGSNRIDTPPNFLTNWIYENTIGELYLTSIDRDGTGQGYDISLLNQFEPQCPVPIIMAGGVGNWAHLAEGLLEPRIDAVATAHLFNFIGDGIMKARTAIESSGISLAKWPTDFLSNH